MSGIGKHLGDSLSNDEMSRLAWQAIWFDLSENGWRSLSIVPVGRMSQTYDISLGLRAIARRFEKGEVGLVDARNLCLDDCSKKCSEIRKFTGYDDRVIVAVDDPLLRPAALPVLRSTDASVLLIQLEHTSIRDARAVLVRCSSERVIGVVALKVNRRRAWRIFSKKNRHIGETEPLWSRSVTPNTGNSEDRGALREPL